MIATTRWAAFFASIFALGALSIQAQEKASSRVVTPPPAPIAAPAKSGPANVSITPRERTPVNTPESITDRRADIRVDTTLVQIPVAVTQQVSGKLVTGLELENFELYEDKVKQEITSFSSEDAPLSVGIVFDSSGSMGTKLTKARQAVTQFLHTANPQDEFFLIQFNDRPQLSTGFTGETEDILNRLSFVQSKGRTALLDAVYMAMGEMKRAKNGRKAILIISDGGDNSSRFTESEVKDAVREADVQIYAIGIFDPFGGGPTPEERSGPGLLGQMTEQTGGRHFAVENLAELPDIAAKIGLELRNEYVLGYTPKNSARDGKYRKVEVKLVKTPGSLRLRTRARGGYYAPAQ